LQKTAQVSKMEKQSDDLAHYSIHDLCRLTDMTARTVRFYIQRGLLDKPEGERRGAWYEPRHLEQLLVIKKWTAAGLSLEAIARLQTDQTEAPPVCPQRRGSVEVRSHMLIADGVEIMISPERARLSPEQLRHLLRQVSAIYQNITETSS
jgi:DNA-binding transcriptional MerR regulator